MTFTSPLSSSEARPIYDKPRWYQPGSLAHYLSVGLGKAPVTFRPPPTAQLTSPENPTLIKALGRFISTILLTAPASPQSDSEKLENFYRTTQPPSRESARTGQELLAQLHREEKPDREALLQTIIHEAKKPGRLHCIQQLIDTASRQHPDEFTNLFPDIYFSLLILYSHSQTEKQDAEKVCIRLLETGMPLKPYQDLGTPLEGACILGYPNIVKCLLKNAPKNLKPNDSAFQPYKRATFAVYDVYRLNPDDPEIYQICDELGKFFCQTGIARYQQRNFPSVAFRGVLDILDYDFESNPTSYKAYDEARANLYRQNAPFSDTGTHRSACDSLPPTEDSTHLNWVSNIQRTVLWIEDLISSRKKKDPIAPEHHRPYDFGTLKNHPTIRGIPQKTKTAAEIMASVQNQIEKDEPDIEYLFSVFIDFMVPAPRPQWELIENFLEILSTKKDHPIIRNLKLEMFCSTLSFFAENNDEYKRASEFCIQLINNGFDFYDGIRAIDGATPLHAALYLQYWDVVEKLIDEDVDVCRCGVRFPSPIHLLKYFIDNERNIRTKFKLQRLARKVGEKCKKHEKFEGQGLEKVGPAAFQKAVECEEAALSRHRPKVRQPRRSLSGLELRLPGEASPKQEYRVLSSSPRQDIEVPKALIDFPEWVMKKYDVGSLRSPAASKPRPTAAEVFQP